MPFGLPAVAARRRSSRLLVALALAALTVGGSSLAVVGIPTAASAPSSGAISIAPSAPSAPAATPSHATGPSAGAPNSAGSAAPTVSFHVAGTHPASWGSATPPGAPVAEPRSAVTTAAAGPSYNESDLWERCFGVWPSVGGQSQYQGNCYGHDEPGFSPYSDLAGSGGNVSWNVTLPVDRSTSHEQTDLYAAIWFGLTLWDPFAVMDQCFLEVQFYPDSSWTTPSGYAAGQWNGAAVAWQLLASTGYENPCFYAPLTVSGSSGGYLEMTQGDTINVTLSGWTTSSTGENLTIKDVSSGQTSYTTLYNSTGNYALDPAYRTASWTNSLLWTPGGEGPVSFAFETGHSGNPAYPESNAYGGCSPGAPPATAANPAVPCPSYDPGFWANDTLVPWQIHAPTFFNATTRETATQVGFGGSTGELNFVDGSSVGFSTCLGRETSAYCSYPWYSFSCSSDAFNFGATDYGGTVDDFGKDLQYYPSTTTDGAGYGYYPLENDSVPACGAPVADVGVTNSPAAAGQTTFLNRTVRGAGTTTFSALALGSYSVAAWPLAGETFTGWTTTGAVTVGSAHDSYTELTVSGNGSVTANFAATSVSHGSFSNVTFFTARPGGNISVTPGLASSRFGSGPFPGETTVGNNTTLSLAPGIYTLGAEAPSGENFTSWTASSGLTVSAERFPVTVLDVPAATNGNVTVAWQSSSSTAFVIGYPFALNGTVALGGTNYSGFFFASLPVGTYSLDIAPSGAGTHFATWSLGGAATMTNFSQSTTVTLEGGTVELYPIGYVDFVLTLNDSGGQGSFAWNTTGNASARAVANGTALALNISGTGSPVVNLTALPAPGWSFSGWTISTPRAVLNSSSTSLPQFLVFLNVSGGYTAGTVTANYVAGGQTNVTYAASPSLGGSVAVNYGTPAAAGTVAVSTDGAFLTAVPAAGYVVHAISATNATTSVSFAAGATTRPWAGSLWVLGGMVATANVTVTVTFVPLSYPVTFVGNSPTGATSAVLNGTTLGTDDTVWLTNGTYSLSAALTGGATFDRWTTSLPGLVLANASLTATTLTVAGPGTVYLLDTYGATRPLVSVTVSPSAIDVLPGGNSTFRANATCLGNTTCQYAPVLHWTLSNPAAGTLNASSGPSVDFVAANASASTYLDLSANLNGTVVAAAPVSISVVPLLVAVEFAPVSGPIFSGEAVSLGANGLCSSNLTCPAGAGFSWSLGNASLGTLVPTGSNASYASTVLFRSGLRAVGTEVVSVSVSLGNVTINDSMLVEVIAPLLNLVTISPTDGTLGAGTTVMYTAIATCSLDLVCPGVPSFTWTLTNPAVGTLNATTGASVELVAGASNATGDLLVNGTLNGVTPPGASLAVTVQGSGTPVLTSVTVTPSTASVQVGSVADFSATVACSPAPCPAGVTIAWALAPDLGTLSTSSGTSTVFTGTSAGTATLWANATLAGRTVSGHASPVTVTGTSGTTGNGSGGLGPYLWVAIGAAAVVIAILAVALYRRRSRGAAPPPENGGAGTAAPNGSGTPGPSTDRTGTAR